MEAAAAAVALVPSAKRGLHTREIFRIAQPLVPDDDDMVQKGVGWLLKETYPKKPRRGRAISGAVARESSAIGAALRRRKDDGGRPQARFINPVMDVAHALVRAVSTLMSTRFQVEDLRTC